MVRHSRPVETRSGVNDHAGYQRFRSVRNKPDEMAAEPDGPWVKGNFDGI